MSRCIQANPWFKSKVKSFSPQRKQRKTIIYVYVVVVQILSATLQNDFMIDLTVTSEMNDSKQWIPAVGPAVYAPLLI